MSLKGSARAVLIAGILIPWVNQAGAVDISGAGSTFIFPVLEKWGEAYTAKTSVSVNYQSIGSGGGIRQIEGRTVDFGASDAPLRPEELDKFGLLQFPVVIGGDVPVINVSGIGSGQLKLTGPVLADIYLGKITKWDDPAIAELNPGLSLPDQAITVVHRSDGSGTTYIWADYLAKVSPEWKTKVGVNAAVEWPTGAGGRGNEGVAGLVSRTPGAIGYVEYAYAKQNKMAVAELRNKDGNFAEPGEKSFDAAAANTNWAGTPGFFLILTDQPGANSWPVTGSTFILMAKAQEKADTAKAVLQFFDWAYNQGAGLAESLDYAPIPANVVAGIEAGWKDIKGADSKPIWAPAP